MDKYIDIFLINMDEKYKKIAKDLIKTEDAAIHIIHDQDISETTARGRIRDLYKTFGVDNRIGLMNKYIHWLEHCLKENSK